MEIKKYYAIFDVAYKKESEARKIEEEWCPKDYVKPVFLILTEEEQEESSHVLEFGGVPYNYNYEGIKQELQDYIDYAV